MAKRRVKSKKTAEVQAPIDPVTAYALAVLAGEIIAGRAVRLACERHLRDLERQRTEDFPYYFDAAAAQRIIDFFPTFLVLEDGRPFHLPAWLQFCDGFVFGWKCWAGDGPEDRWIAASGQARGGLRRIQHGFYCTSKGSGKSPSAAGKALYLAGFDGEQYAQIYTTGFDREQAGIILRDAIRMVESSPDDEFRAEFEVTTKSVLHKPTGSFIQAMSSQHRSKSGPRPSAILSDEIHEHRDGTVVSKAEAGFKGRGQPLGLKYTNTGSDKTSYCWELNQKSMDVLEGRIVDEQWFAYVCHLDPCPACFEEGYRQPKDGCPDCDNWTDPVVWPKVAPALGVVIQPKYLQDAVTRALTMPSEFNMVRRLNFCFWTETNTVWISSDQWDACKVPAVLTSNPDRRPATVAFDLSSKFDLSSAVVAIRFDDPPGTPKEEVEIEGMNEDGDRVVHEITLNFSIELVPFFWIPRDTLHERVRKEHIPYDVWERSGHLFVTKGPVIDHEAIYQFIAKDIVKRFHVQKIGYDEHDATMFAVKLRDHARLGDKVVAVPQGKKLSEVNKLIEVLVRSRRLRHDGQPVLAWNFANCEPDRDKLGALQILKAGSFEGKRIDGYTASAMAIHQLMTLPATRKRSIGVMFV